MVTSTFNWHTFDWRHWPRYTEAKFAGVFRLLKAKRVELFVEQLGLTEEHRILDLGSEDGSYLASHYPWPHRIHLADIELRKMERGVQQYGLAGFHLLDPQGPLPFEDQYFDAVWCNSVIEHVTLPMDALATVSHSQFVREAEEHQCRFAGEVRRVGKRWFVQVPHQHFPVESHAWFPLVQYLPQPIRWQLARWMRPFWIKRWIPDFHLYDRKRIREDFPDATGYYEERAFGLIKSLIAWKA